MLARSRNRESRTEAKAPIISFFYFFTLKISTYLYDWRTPGYAVARPAYPMGPSLAAVKLIPQPTGLPNLLPVPASSMMMKIEDEALFTSLINRTFQLEQYFSLTRNQPEQCFGLFF